MTSYTLVLHSTAPATAEVVEAHDDEEALSIGLLRLTLGASRHDAVEVYQGDRLISRFSRDEQFSWLSSPSMIMTMLSEISNHRVSDDCESNR